MYSLLIDTSTKYLCVGVSKDYKVIYKRQEEVIKKQSEFTIPYLKEMLDSLNLTLNDINEVVVTIGPGSFTGIRIGMCIAKVLASLNHIDLKAVSSLNAFANLGKKIVLLDAKAERAYVGIYNDNKKVIDECVLPLEEVNELINKYNDYDICLDAWLINKETCNFDVIENLNRIAVNIKPVDNVDNLVPIYLKDR